MPWTVSISIIGFKFRRAVTKQREDIRSLAQGVPSDSGYQQQLFWEQTELPPKRERCMEFLLSQHPHSLDSLG